MLMTGTIVAQLITLVSTPIVTRLYTPEMIGVISVYLAFFNFWFTLLTWRYEGALLISENEEESHHIFRLGVMLSFITSFFAAPVLYALQNFKVLGFDALPDWAPGVAWLSLLGYGWFMMYRSWALRFSMVRPISGATVSRSAANAGTRVLLGIAESGVQGLFVAEIFGSWAALSSLRKKVKKGLSVKAPSWNIRQIKNAAFRYKNFPRFELPSTLINQLAIALPVPIVGALYGSKAAGFLGLARLLYAIPNRQIGKAVADVFQMELANCVRHKNYERAQSLFNSFSAKLALFGLLPVAIAITVAPLLVPYAFGDDWNDMGDVIALMAPWMYGVFVVGSLSRIFSVLEKQQWKLFYDLVSLFIVIACAFFASNYGLDLNQFVACISFGLLFSYMFYYMIMRLVLKNAQEV